MIHHWHGIEYSILFGWGRKDMVHGVSLVSSPELNSGDGLNWTHNWYYCLVISVRAKRIKSIRRGKCWCVTRQEAYNVTDQLITGERWPKCAISISFLLSILALPDLTDGRQPAHYFNFQCWRKISRHFKTLTKQLFNKAIYHSFGRAIKKPGNISVINQILPQTEERLFHQFYI